MTLAAGIVDSAPRLQSALAGKAGDDANKALHTKEAELRQSCGSNPSVRCDVVSLYHGRVYDLYRYKRYTDVRLRVYLATHLRGARVGRAPSRTRSGCRNLPIRPW